MSHVPAPLHPLLTTNDEYPFIKLERRRLPDDGAHDPFVGPEQRTADTALTVHQDKACTV